MWLAEAWNDLVLKFKKKFLGYVEPPPKWASSVTRTPGTSTGSRQGKVMKGDVTDWLSKTNKDAVRTSDNSGSLSPGLSAADRAAIFGLVDVVEKLSEDLRIVSYKVDALYKSRNGMNSSTIPSHPFGVDDTNDGAYAAGNDSKVDNDDLMEQMKQTERAWSVFWLQFISVGYVHQSCIDHWHRFKVGAQARFTAQTAINKVPLSFYLPFVICLYSIRDT